MIKRVLPLLSLILLSAAVSGQRTLGLNDCIDLALDNSLSLQQSEISLQQRAVSTQVARGARLPDLNGNLSNNYSFGRSIDPFSNAFINQRFSALSVNLSSSTTLFGGFRIQQTIRQRELEWLSSKSNQSFTEQQIRLDVAELYLAALQAKSSMDVFQKNLELTKELLKQAQVRVDAGVETEMRLYELRAQQMNDKANFTQAENQFSLALLDLANYLNTDPIDDVQDIGNRENYLDTTYAPEVTDYKSILNSQPQYQRDQYLVNAGHAALKVAESQRYPSLNLLLNLNSVYSSRSSLPHNPSVKTFPIGYVEGSNEVVYTQQQQFEYYTPGLFNQLENNFGQTVGFRLAVPIFNKFQVSAGIEQASLSLKQQELQLRRTENDFRNTFSRAEKAFQNALASYQTALSNVEAQKALFEQAEVSYKAGAMSYYDWLLNRNSLQVAELNRIRAAYELMFRRLSLEYLIKGEWE